MCEHYDSYFPEALSRFGNKLQTQKITNETPLRPPSPDKIYEPETTFTLTESELFRFAYFFGLSIANTIQAQMLTNKGSVTILNQYIVEPAAKTAIENLKQGYKW